MRIFFQFLKVFSIFFVVSLFLVLFYPDIVLADTTSTLRPSADGGDDGADWKNTGGTACNATDCYIEVDESSGSSCTNSDGDTSYIEVKPSGASITFDIDESSIPNNSTISAINITVCHKQKKVAASNDFQTRRCVDASCSNSGTNISAGADYAQATQSHSGLDITKTGSTDIEIGVVIIGAEVRISQVSAVITYTSPDIPPDIPPDTTAVTSVPGGGGDPRKATFSGQAYPESKIELLIKRAEIASFVKEPVETLEIFDDGTFRMTLKELLGVDFLFALRVEDKEGRKTGIISFDVDMRSEGELIAEDIFVPPTIGFDKVVVTKGQELKIAGYATSNNKIEIEIDNIIKREARSDETGYWAFTMATVDLKLGEHYVRVRQIDNSERESDFSSFGVFKVSLLELPKADFNDDNVINITDWSIFLYRWGSEDETLRSKIDMDDDGKIDIRDFSIFLKSIKI